MLLLLSLLAYCFDQFSTVSRHCRRKRDNGIRSRKVSSFLITRLCDSSALFWEGVSYAMSSYQFWWFIPILLIPILMIQIFFWIYWSKKFYLPIKWLNYWSKEYNTDHMIKLLIEVNKILVLFNWSLDTGHFIFILVNWLKYWSMLI